MYVTNISRTDIAEGKKTYQSNEVDNHGSHLAVMAPYDLGSKTRREADPWWEIDLGMSYHLSSVSLTIKSGVQQALEVNIILFDGPVGFENPFLDSMKDICVDMYTIVLPATSRPRKELVEWNMSGNLVGGALRVQLRGLHTLHLYRFQAYQGDEIHPDSLEREDERDFMKSQLSLEIGEEGFDTLMAAEDKRRFNSYASYHPDTFKNTQVYKQRMTRSFAKSSDSSGRKKGSMRERVDSSVANLNAKYQGRHMHINDWIDRAKEASQYFTTEELIVARDMIFNSAMASVADEEKKKKGDETPGFSRRNSSFFKRMPSMATGRSEYNNAVRAQDMYGAALVELYPRIPLEAVAKALRRCAGQVQGRDQKGEIGLMQHSPRFLFLTASDIYVIDRFEIVAKAIKEALVRRSKFSSPTRGASFISQPSPGDMKFETEISWSQFVLLLYCLSIGSPDDVPLLAFNRYDIKIPVEDEKKKKRREQQQQQQKHLAECSFPVTHRSAEGDDDFFITANDNMSPTGVMGNTAADDVSEVASIPKRPKTPANELPPPQRSKLTQALSPPKRFRDSGMEVSMMMTAPAMLGSVQSSALDNRHKESIRDRTKKEPLTLKEKTKDELIERLNLNFGHAQYKLGRIQSRVDVDVPPRRLRVKLTNVKLDQVPGGLNALDLGLRYPEELFEIGAGLSATGQPPEARRITTTVTRKSLGTQSPGSQKSVSSSRDGSVERLGSLSFDNDDRSVDDVSDQLSEASLNQKSKRQGSDVDKPKMSKTSVQLSRRKLGGSTESKRPSTTTVISHTSTAMPSTHKDIAVYDECQKNDSSFKKSCALCLYKYPLTSLNNMVLLKHVVDLRRIWNPKLVTKFEGRLAEGMCLYGLVPVCNMCNQYFDPDFESGISPPSQSKGDKTEESSILKPRKEPIEFYDNRYSGLTEAGHILREEETLTLRSRARRANEISEEIKKETLRPM